MALCQHGLKAQKIMRYRQQLRGNCQQQDVAPPAIQVLIAVSIKTSLPVNIGVELQIS